MLVDFIIMRLRSSHPPRGWRRQWAIDSKKQEAKKECVLVQHLSIAVRGMAVNYSCESTLVRVSEGFQEKIRQWISTPIAFSGKWLRMLSVEKDLSKVIRQSLAPLSLYSCFVGPVQTSLHWFCLNFQLLGHMLIVARKVAEKKNLTNGYRVGKL